MERSSVVEALKMVTPSSVLGTELLERVQALASRYEPLGFSAVRDARNSVENFASAAEVVLGCPRWDTVAQDIALRCTSLSSLGSTTHFAGLADLCAGHAVALHQRPAYRPSPGTPNRSGIDVDDAADGRTGRHESPPQQQVLRSTMSFAEVASAAALAPDTTTQPTVARGSEPAGAAGAGSEPHAALGVMAALSEVLLLLRAAELAFQALSQVHFDATLAATSWRWVSRQSPRSRILLRLLVAPWRALLTTIPYSVFSAAVRRRIMLDEDRVIHDALLRCRHCDVQTTELIGILHSVVTTIRTTIGGLLEALESSPEAVVGPSTTLDASGTLAAVTMELRSLVASACNKLAAACEGSLQYASKREEAAARCGGRPAVVADIVAAFVGRLSDIIAQCQPPTAMPRLKLLAIVGLGFGLLQLRQRAAAFPLLALRATAAVEAYVVSPALGIIQGLLTVPAKPDRRATQKEMEALQLMVVQYHQDMSAEPLDASDVAQIKSAVERSDLGRVSSDYVEFIRRPLVPLVKGLLPRLILIQVQQQKVDMDMLLDSTNDVLAQNDLVFRMFACIPFGVFASLAVLIRRRRHARHRSALFADMRVCWWKLHRIMCGNAPVNEQRALLTLKVADDDEEQATAAVGENSDNGSAVGGPFEPRHPLRTPGTTPAGGASQPLRTATPALQQPAPVVVPSTAGSSSSSDGGAPAESSSWGGTLQPKEQGEILIQVHALRVMSEMIWPQRQAEAKMRFLDDLDEVEAKDASREARLRVLDRMSISYSFLRHSEQY